MNVIIKYDKVTSLNYFQDKCNMIIDKNLFETIIKNDIIKCVKYVYKDYRNLFDLYFNNNIYAIARQNCRKFFRQLLFEK